MFTINKHRKSKISNRKLFISAQDKFYDLPIIYQHLLPSKAQNEQLIEMQNNNREGQRFRRNSLFYIITPPL
jgi:hypothetical protein